MQVVGNRVMIAADARRTSTDSGLILPPSAQEESQIGVVVGIGDGEYHERTGRWMPIVSVEIGDHVLYSKYGGTVIEVDDEEMLLISPNDIFAIVGDD